MNNKSVSMVIMTGVDHSTHPQSILSQAIESSTLDLIDKGQRSAGIDQVIVCANSTRLASLVPDEVALKATEEDSFDFGRTFSSLVRRRRLEGVLYFGGGSGVLLDVEDLDSMANFLRDKDRIIIANNFYSTDFMGVTPANALLQADLGPRDNSLGWSGREVGLDPFEFPRTAATQFDIDSPLDLVVLKIWGEQSGRLGQFLSSMDFDHQSLKDLLPLFVDPQRTLAISGRIGASTWSHLERNAACRINLISEGRGSHSDDGGRRAPGSLVGSLYDSFGSAGMFKRLLAMGEALIMDTRPLFRRSRTWPSPADRFWSDLQRPEKIENPQVRKLTEDSLDAGSTVVLGGHSVVSGSLYLLTDKAWQDREHLREKVNLSLATALDSVGRLN